MTLAASRGVTDLYILRKDKTENTREWFFLKLIINKHNVGLVHNNHTRFFKWNTRYRINTSNERVWCTTQLAMLTCWVSTIETVVLRPVTMETLCFHKKSEFQRFPPKDFCTARYEHKSSKKVSNFSKTPKKIIQIGLRKTQPNVCLKRRDSESWTDIDRQMYSQLTFFNLKKKKPNDCAMKSERGALARGSDPPSGHKCSQNDRW